MADKPLRLGWWWLPIILLGLLAIACLVLTLWLNSSADLDAQIARAKALGLSMDPTPAAVRRSSSDALLLKRIASICESSPRYVGNDSGQWRWDPFRDPPADAVAWKDTIAGSLDPLIDGLSGTASWTSAIHRLEVRDLPTKLWDWQRYELDDVFALRSVTPANDPAVLATRIARVATTMPFPGLAGHMTSLRLAQAWQRHVLRHRSGLAPAPHAAAASDLARTLDERLTASFAIHPLLQAMVLRLPPEGALRAMNVRLPQIMTWELSLRCFHRAGRGRILSRAIDTAAWIAAHGLPTTTIDLLTASPLLPPLSWRNAGWELYQEVVCGGWCTHCRGSRCTFEHSLLEQHLRTTTGLRLLAADLAGTAWPADPGDPSGGMLRPILRDGAVIGAYGYGGDGIDGGGSVKADWCWPLRARLGYPRAADSPPAD